MVGITGVLGRHVGRDRTRALQHHARFDPAVRRREINYGSRKGGRSLGRRRTHTDSAGPKIRAHREGEMSDPFFAMVYADDHLLIRAQHSDDD